MVVHGFTVDIRAEYMHSNATLIARRSYTRRDAPLSHFRCFARTTEASLHKILQPDCRFSALKRSSSSASCYIAHLMLRRTSRTQTGTCPFRSHSCAGRRVVWWLPIAACAGRLDGLHAAHKGLPRTLFEVRMPPYCVRLATSRTCTNPLSRRLA